MLSLFVVNANLAPAASREKQQQVTQAKALAQTRRGSPCGAVGGVFFSLPFFSVWRVLLPFIFTVKYWRQTGQHGGEELVLPPPQHGSPLLPLRDAQAALLTPSRCPILAASLLGLCSQPGSQSHHSLSPGGLRSRKASSAHSCSPRVTGGCEPGTEAQMGLRRYKARLARGFCGQAGVDQVSQNRDSSDGPRRAGSWSLSLSWPRE